MTSDLCVVGGGIVGAATALHLLRMRPGASLVLLEKEAGPARHQTGHNSGVIHSGVYYTPGSLKARLCREGTAAVRELCAEHGIPVDTCGKLIVATDERERARLATLLERAVANGVLVHALDRDALRELEPKVRGIAAALVPGTGVVDFTQVTEAILDEVVSLGGVVHYGAGVLRIDEHPGHVDVTTRDAVWRARRVVVCGGLQADRLARAAGLDLDMRIVPFRGEYYRLPQARADLVSHLIYPVPDPALPFLGVHVTRTVDGGLTLGPNAVLGLSREGYRKGSVSMRDVAETARFGGTWRFAARHHRTGLRELRNSLVRRRYLDECRKFCPDLTVDDLLDAPAGIRAQVLRRDGSMVEDFTYRRTDRMLHMINAPSPAATAALPIGAHVARLCLDQVTVG